MSDTIQFIDEHLKLRSINKIETALDNNKIGLLSLRHCELKDEHLFRVLKLVQRSKCLHQLSLSVGMLGTTIRRDALAETLKKNRSLSSLLLHGNDIQDKGFSILSLIIINHPNIIILDIGDSGLTDESMGAICQLVGGAGSRPGLQELTLSCNRNITSSGWVQLAITLTNNSTLKKLYIDYNNVKDYGGSCLVMSLLTNKLEVLDMEATAITEVTFKVIIQVLEKGPSYLRKLNIKENKITDSTLEYINQIIENIECKLDATSSDKNSKNSNSATTKNSGSQQNVEVKVRDISAKNIHKSKHKKEESESEYESESEDSDDSDEDDEELTPIEPGFQGRRAINVECNSVSDKTKTGSRENKQRKKVDDDSGDELQEVDVFKNQRYQH